jgi:sugar/nucleoside kinase (ribokinase family)
MTPTSSPARVYLYGMIVLSTIHRLKGEYPAADAYGEIDETHVVPGGETGNSALVLARWGHPVKVAGPFLGTDTQEPVTTFLTARGIDCAALHYDPSFAGVRDLVLVAGATRTVFGQFGRYFGGPRRWSEPARDDIAAADVVGLDPFFGDQSVTVARLCRELNKPYVTIDCAPESELHRGAAVTVVSGEHLRQQFPGDDRQELLARYSAGGGGLTIFTAGSGEILFARGGTIRSVEAFRIVPKSTLGAGDTFRGGVVHAVAAGLDDTAVVKFAAATAACVCERFPMAHQPPELAEVTARAASH